MQGEDHQKIILAIHPELKSIVKENNGEKTKALNTDIVKMKSELIGILKNEIKSVSTYRLQKMGIDKKQYNRIRENPEQMSMETMVKYLEKIRAQKN
jgi:hypothetical protein